MDGGSQGLENRAAVEEEARFGGEGFPDEAQLIEQTYSAVMAELTTSTR